MILLDFSCWICCLFNYMLDEYEYCSNQMTSPVLQNQLINPPNGTTEIFFWMWKKYVILGFILLVYVSILSCQIILHNLIISNSILLDHVSILRAYSKMWWQSDKNRIRNFGQSLNFRQVGLSKRVYSTMPNGHCPSEQQRVSTQFFPEHIFYFQNHSGMVWNAPRISIWQKSDGISF